MTKWYIYFRFPHQNTVRISLLPMNVTCPAQFFLPLLDLARKSLLFMFRNSVKKREVFESVMTFQLSKLCMCVCVCVGGGEGFGDKEVQSTVSFQTVTEMYMLPETLTLRPQTKKSEINELYIRNILFV